jgi:cytochrome oxidase Cu insertion factor (SCO1/SenC/PrrC family)
MLRWLASLVIVGLLGLTALLPSTSIGRRGAEASLRADVPHAVGRVGERMPDFTLPDLDGTPVRLADLRGHPVLVTFERSVDW